MLKNWKKKKWLKLPKAVPPKKKFGPKYKLFKISYLKLFFWKNFFGHSIFLYSSTCFSGHHQSFFLISDFLAESHKASKNYRRSSLILQYSFVKKTSIIIWISTAPLLPLSLWPCLGTSHQLICNWFLLQDTFKQT